jgi:crotonobetainyl-CoA:carnitine CoA-transferase CaiB-like acyl-CoA transferase
VPIVDIAAGMFAATAILAALRARDHTGAGQLVDISLLDAQVALLVNVASNYLVGGMEHRRLGNAHPNIAPYEAFRARDRWFMLAAGSERLWRALCDRIGRPDLKEDPRFATNGARVSNRPALVEVLGEIFAARDVDEWLADLREADIPCGPINTIPDVFDHPQAEARGLSLETEHPTAGPLRLSGWPYKLSQTPADVRRPPPLLGQHTAEVLVELLEHSDADVAALREQGAI